MPRPSPVPGLGSRTPVGEAARATIGSRLADVLSFEPSLRRGLTPDRVHDIRVACRRLRAALDVFNKVADDRQAQGEVKRLQDALGPVRDRHVQLEWLSQEPAASHVAARLSKELGASSVRLMAALDRFASRGAPAVRAAAQSAGGAGPFAGKEVRKRVEKRLSRLDREIDELLEGPDALRAHQIRKTLKKLRYEFEVIGPALPELAQETLALFKPLQDLLGTLHDHDVRLALLAQEVGTRARGLLRLQSAVAQERDRLMDRTLSSLLRFKDERVTSALRAMLRKATGRS